MIDLLLRIFARKRRATAPDGEQLAIGALASAVGIACNVLLFAAKLTTGLLIGAVSVVADAVNNLSDAASSIITLAGFRLAQRPADEDHPYGHARYEYVAGFVVSLLVLLIGFETAKSAVDKILHPEPMRFTWAAAAVMIASIGVKLWLARFYGRTGRRIGSGSLMASAVDSRNDVTATAAVLAGCAAYQLWGWNIDGWAGLAVALFILWSGIGIFRETLSPLLGQQANRELREAISRLILAHGQVLGIHDMQVHDYGPGRYYASVHVELNADEDPLVCHDIIDDIEWDALRELNVNLVIHHDPILVGDSEWNEMRDLVEEIIAGIDPALSLHDFRMAQGTRQLRLAFDLEVPYALDAADHDALKHRIDDALLQCGRPCKTVIRFDGKV